MDSNISGCGRKPNSDTYASVLSIRDLSAELRPMTTVAVALSRISVEGSNEMDVVMADSCVDDENLAIDGVHA